MPDDGASDDEPGSPPDGLLAPGKVPARGAGTYVLVVDLPAPATPEVGALGPTALPAGAYAYVGSALGRSGFGRVGRHAAVAAGENDARHWHVDHLLGLPDATLAGVALAPDAAVECAWAAALDPDGDPSPAGAPPGLSRVEGFGATDCDCPAHLFGLPAGGSPDHDADGARGALADAVLAARDRAASDG